MSHLRDSHNKYLMAQNTIYSLSKYCFTDDEFNEKNSLNYAQEGYDFDVEENNYNGDIDIYQSIIDEVQSGGRKAVPSNVNLRNDQNVFGEFSDEDQDEQDDSLFNEESIGRLLEKGDISVFNVYNKAYEYVFKSLFKFGKSYGLSWKDEEKVYQEVLIRKRRERLEKERQKRDQMFINSENHLKSSLALQQEPGKLKCSPFAVLASYVNETLYFCNGNNVTKEQYDILVKDKNNTCSTQGLDREICICPLDLKGETCRAWRSFECANELVEPKFNCDYSKRESYGGVFLDGDFPCLEYKSTDTVTFKSRIKCKFVEPPNSQQLNANVPRNVNLTLPQLETNATFDQVLKMFRYWHISPYNQSIEEAEFARTKKMSKTYDFKAYNFFSFSDTSGVVGVPMDEVEYLNGDKLISHSVSFKSLSDEFFSGNRLYAEVGFHETEPGMQNAYMNRLFVDFADKKSPNEFDYKTLLLAIFIPLGIIVGGIVVLLVVVIIFLNRYKKKKELEKFMNLAKAKIEFLPPIDYSNKEEIIKKYERK